MAREYRNLPEMEQMHARYEKSGLTLTEFCEREGINKYTFQYWRTKIKSEKKQERIASAQPIGFRQIIPESNLTGSVIRLRLLQDRDLELPADYPPEQLLQILRGLTC